MMKSRSSGRVLALALAVALWGFASAGFAVFAEDASKTPAGADAAAQAVETQAAPTAAPGGTASAPKTPAGADVVVVQADAARTASIHMSYQEDGSGFRIARAKFDVSAALAESYGYEDAFDGEKVSALDAIVAAHIAVFGADKDAVNSKLVQLPSQYGGTFISGFMGDGAGNMFFTVNKKVPEYGAPDVELHGGDVVELFAIHDTEGYQDALTWFEAGEPKQRIDEAGAKTGAPLRLTVMRHTGMGWGELAPLAGAGIVPLRAPKDGGAAFDVTRAVVTGEDGSAEFVFYDPGTYVLSVMDVSTDDKVPLAAPWLMVTVTGEPVAMPTGPVHQAATPDAVHALAAKVAAHEMAAIGQAKADGKPLGYGAEWMMFALVRGGFMTDGVKADWLAQLEADLLPMLETGGGRIDANKPTENTRVILALTALGVDATDFAGHDLTAPLADKDYALRNGVNAAIYTLLALDSGKYPVPSLPAGSAGARLTRDGLVAEIVARQIGSSGGWALGGDVADADVTAMALQALAPYYHRGNADIDPIVDRGIEALSAMQDSETAGFGSPLAGAAATYESNVQALVALNALGISIEDARFAKNGLTLYDVLRTYYIEESAAQGAFSHIAEDGVNGMATDQGLYALASLERALAPGTWTLYDMGDAFAYKKAFGADPVMLLGIALVIAAAVVAIALVARWRKLGGKIRIEFWD